MSREIASHETLHALGAACAVEMLGLPYDAACVTVDISASEGKCLAEIGDIETDHEAREKTRRVMALAAVAPCATEPDAIKMLRGQQWDSLVEAGQLSREDVELLADAHMPDPSLACARLISALQVIRKRLGATGWQKLTHALRDVSNQNLGSLTLSELVPQAIIRRALKEGDEALALHINAKSEGEAQLDAIKRRTKAQEAVEKDKQERQERDERAAERREKRLTRKSP